MANIETGKNIAVTRSNEFVPIPSGTNSKPIFFRPDQITQNAPIYAANELGVPLTAQNLADISTINDSNGQPTGQPANGGVHILQWDTYRVDWYNVLSYNIVFDLEKQYNLDYAYVWGIADKNSPITLSASEDGVTWKTLAPARNGFSPTGWTKIDFNQANKGGNFWFRIEMSYQDYALNAFVLYGRPATSSLNKGIKKRRNIGTRTTDASTGTNGFYFEHPELMAPVSGETRFYVQPDWIMGQLWRLTGSLIGKLVSDMTFRFHTSHLGSIDQLLQGFKNYGIKTTFCLSNMPAAFRPVTTIHPGESKPVDPGFSTTNINHTTNPQNYKFIARLGYNLAARYGNNKNVDTQFIQLDPNEPLRVGMNLIYCLEIGNEMDKWWEGAQGYCNAQEMGAYLSALYDGDQGRLGAGFGIKNADPSIRVCVPSLAAGNNVTYMRDLTLYCDKTRGVGNYPWDDIGYHWYNTTGISQVSTDGGTSHGLQPEKGNLMPINKDWSDFRDEHCPAAEVILSEWGYDSHLGGAISPDKNTQFLRSRCQSYWLCRGFMCNQISGVDITNQYWFANQGGTRFTDLDQNEPDPKQFLSSGLMDGVQDSSDWNRFPLMPYWYVAAFRKMLTKYQFSHSVMEAGVQMTDEVIINTNNNNTVWAAAYTNYIDGTKLLVVWLDSSDLLAATVQVNVIGDNVPISSIDGAEIRESFDPVVTQNPVVNGSIDVIVNECPQFLLTPFTGTAKIQQATNIRKQRLDSSSVLVTWTDSNLQEVDAVVSKSTNVNTGYTVIYQGSPSVDGSYVDTTAFLEYNYRVQLVIKGDIITPPDPDPDFSKTLNTEEQWASMVYYAVDAVKYNTSTPAINNDSIGQFVEKKTGQYPLIYRGNAVTDIYQRPPFLLTDSSGRGFVEFWNSPNLGFSTEDFKKQNGDYDYQYYSTGATFIMMRMPGQSSEAAINDQGGRFFVSELNGGYRVYSARNDGSQRVIFGSGNGDALPPVYQICSVHVEYVKNGNIGLWVNNVYKGSIPNDIEEGTGNYGDIAKLRNALGVYTNSMGFRFYAYYIHNTAEFANIAANRDQFLTSVGNKWNVGTYDPLPHPDNNIQLNYNTSLNRFELNFTASTATQSQIDNAEIRWYVMTPAAGDGSFTPQNYIKTGKYLNRSDFQQIYDDHFANPAPPHFWASAYIRLDGAISFVQSPYKSIYAPYEQ